MPPVNVTERISDSALFLIRSVRVCIWLFYLATKTILSLENIPGSSSRVIFLAFFGTS